MRCWFAWIFQHSRGSLLLAILTYVGVHLNNPGHLLPSRSAPFVIQVVAYVLLGIGLARQLSRATSAQKGVGTVARPE